MLWLRGLPPLKIFTQFYDIGMRMTALEDHG